MVDITEAPVIIQDDVLISENGTADGPFAPRSPKVLRSIDFDEMLLLLAAQHEREVSEKITLRSEVAKLRERLKKAGLEQDKDAAPQTSSGFFCFSSPMAPPNGAMTIKEAAESEEEPQVPAITSAEMDMAASRLKQAAQRSPTKRMAAWTSMPSDKEPFAMGSKQSLRDEGTPADPSAVMKLQPMANGAKNIAPGSGARAVSGQGPTWVSAGSDNSYPLEKSPSKQSAEMDDFNLRTSWTDNGPKLSKLHSNLMKRLSMSEEAPMTPRTWTSENVKEDDYGPTEMSTGWTRHLLSPPGSHFRLAWDVVGALLIFYDLIAIPLTVFSPPAVDFTVVMDWITLLFWTANMFSSPFVGYIENGVTVMVPKKIFAKYMRSWFIIDALTVPPDWAFSLTEAIRPNGLESEEGDGAESGGFKLLRILRLMRMTRLLRLVKLRRLLQSINDFIDSEYYAIITNIVKMIILLCVINHIIACIWFAIGSEISGEHSWINAHGIQHDVWIDQYMNSFHWSITQFTPSSMPIGPVNLVERTFTVAVIVFALVGFSYVVGSISGSLAQLRAMQEDSYKQFWMLRRYLKRNKLPVPLQHRIRKYLEHAWMKQKENLPASQIKILSLLSDQLNCELVAELSVPYLKVHPLFEQLTAISGVTINRLATSAISRKSLAINDTLFYPTETATHMYLITGGRLSYLKASPDMLAGDMERQTSKRSDTAGMKRQSSDGWLDAQANKDWIAEPVLWMTNWIHLGKLMATTTSELMTVDPNKFAEVIRMNPPSFKLAKIYSQSFVLWLNGEAKNEADDLYTEEVHHPLAISFMGDDYEAPVLNVNPLAQLKATTGVAQWWHYLMVQLGRRKHSHAVAPSRGSAA